MLGTEISFSPVGHGGIQKIYDKAFKNIILIIMIFYLDF